MKTHDVKEGNVTTTYRDYGDNTPQPMDGAFTDNTMKPSGGRCSLVAGTLLIILILVGVACLV